MREHSVSLGELIAVRERLVASPGDRGAREDALRSLLSELTGEALRSSAETARWIEAERDEAAAMQVAATAARSFEPR